MAIDARDGQPLVVDDVAIESGAKPAHVGEVLGHLEGQPHSGFESPFGRPAVEELCRLVAIGGRHRTVQEPGREQLDVDPS